MIDNNSFIYHVNHVAKLDSSLAMSLTASQNNVVLNSGIVYNAVSTLSMYNRTTNVTEELTVNGSALTSANIDSYLGTIKTQIESSYPVLMTHSAASQTTSVATFNNINTSLVLSGNGYYIRDFNIVISDVTGVKYTIDSILNSPIELTPKILDLTPELILSMDSIAQSVLNINNVSGDLGNISAVADDLANINAVSSSINNVDAVSANIANINTVASIQNLNNITTVANDLNGMDLNGIADVTIVANDLVLGVNSSVNKVSADISNVNAVSSDLANINIVASDIANINNVVGSATQTASDVILTHMDVITTHADVVSTSANSSSALASANSATTSASSASTSATNAATSASNASSNAASSLTNSNNATNSANAAFASATSANSSALSASTHAGEANTSANSAASNASSASTSVANATASATSASASAASASVSETNAVASAVNTASDLSSITTMYNQVQSDTTTVTTAASNANTSALNAATSASSSNTSAINASSSATAAAASASSAQIAADSVIAVSGFNVTDYYTKTNSDARFEPLDSTILKSTDIGVSIQAYDSAISSSSNIDNTLGSLITGVGDLTIIQGGGSGGSQVQTDWNATSGLGVLLNKPTNVSAFINDSGYLTSVAWSAVSSKPTFATVATSGSYTDLSNQPTIPAAQVQTDWNASTGLGVLLNKPDLSAMTNQGNTFNGASQLVQLGSNGKLPAVDGSLLTGISGGFTSTYSSNRTYMNQKNASLSGIVVSNCYQTSIQIRKDVMINGIAFYPYSLSASSFNTILGIYNVNSDGHATTLIAQTVYTVINVAGFYILSITPTLLPAGNYALVMYSDTIVGNPYCYFHASYSHDDIFGITNGAVPTSDSGYYFNNTGSSSVGLATNVTALNMASYSKSILMGVRVQ